MCRVALGGYAYQQKDYVYVNGQRRDGSGVGEAGEVVYCGGEGYDSIVWPVG